MKKNSLIAMVVIALVFGLTGCANTPATVEPAEVVEQTDGETSASVDANTSASIVPEALVQTIEAKGFTEGEQKKALFVVGDPRKYSVNYDLVNTAVDYFQQQGVEVEVRDLYDIGFDPVLSLDEFYYAKDGTGEPTAEIKAEQVLVADADYLIFAYANWHDTPNAMVKGYMEKVFAKTFAYQNTENGLEGLLTGKSMYTIMNAGFLGGGRGYIGDGVGIDDEAWDRYMNAFKVFDDDTAGFWNMENKGRFVNDRTPKNNSETYEEDLNQLRDALRAELDQVFFQN